MYVNLQTVATVDSDKITAKMVDEDFLAGLGSENLATYQDFIEDYTSPKVPTEMLSAWACMGMVAEAGEVMAEFEKGMRKGDFEERREKIILELGDVLWYAGALCNALDISMEEVIVKNVYKLEGRANGTKE